MRVSPTSPTRGPWRSTFALWGCPRGRSRRSATRSPSSRLPPTGTRRGRSSSGCCRSEDGCCSGAQASACHDDESPLRGGGRRRDGRRVRVPAPPARGDLPPRPAGRPDRSAGRPGQPRRARRQPEDERDRARGGARVRDAHGIPPGPPALPRTRPRARAGGAAAGAPACGRRDRPARRVRACRSPRRRAGRARPADRVHADRRRARGRLRREPLLPPRRRRGVRGRRRGYPRRGADARRRALARVRTRRAAARRRGARGRVGARARARSRRVRRDDHLRRLAAGRHPDAAARDLRAVRARPRRRACDQRALHRRRRGDPRRAQGLRMASLRLDLAVPTRSFQLELALAVGRETVALVGPSGSGKTTVLRAVAGLQRPSRGTVECDGTVWFGDGTNLRPEQRSVGFVFQEYALFPHLSVERNVRFGGVAADGLLDRLGIAHLAKAKPRELSGGERQRVALARALARQPSVLLPDEPTAALDAHTRSLVRAELHDVLRELRLPTLLVTHDFEDAAALADRVGVLVEGRLRQLGTPAELLGAPADPYVARLAGANVLAGDASPGPDGLTAIRLDSGATVYSAEAAVGRVSVLVYPRDVALAREAPDDSALNHIPDEIISVTQLGNRARVRLRTLTAEVTTASAERLRLAPGERVVASFKATQVRLLSSG